MKGALLLILILFYTAIVAQVPVPMEEMRLDIVTDIGNENAGHFSKTKNMVLFIPKTPVKKPFTIKSLTVQMAL